MTLGISVRVVGVLCGLWVLHMSPERLDILEDSTVEDLSLVRWGQLGMGEGWSFGSGWLVEEEDQPLHPRCSGDKATPDSPSCEGWRPRILADRAHIKAKGEPLSRLGNPLYGPSPSGAFESSAEGI